MNPSIHEFTDPPTQSACVPEIGQIIPPELADALPKKKKRREQGKIAKLPHEQQDLVNCMLYDGKTYEFVAEEMAKLGVSLNGENISNWFNGPHQDYVRDREWREDLLVLSQSGTTLDGLSFGQKFQESLVQLAFAEIFRALKDPETRTDRLNHIRILNSLARLNREALNVRKYNDLRADKAAAQLPPPDAAPSPEKAREILFTSFEEALGFPGSPAPIGPDLNQILSARALALPEQREGGSASSSASLPSIGSAKEGASLAAPERLVAPNPASAGEGGPALRSAFGEGGSVPPALRSALDEGGSDTAPPLTDSLTHSPTNCSASQPSTPQLSTSPSELCYSCGVPLPPLKPDGTRPSPACPGCQIRLYPPGTTFEQCQVCDAFVPIKPGGERTSDHCAACGQKLPPPGRRYMEECKACGAKLRTFDADGKLISDRCRYCHAPVTLLEPMETPASPSTDHRPALAA